MMGCGDLPALTFLMRAPDLGANRLARGRGGQVSPGVSVESGPWRLQR